VPQRTPIARATRHRTLHRHSERNRSGDRLSSRGQDRRTEKSARYLVTRLTLLPVTISLTLMTSVAAHPEPIGTRTCARWLDGREQHLSTTMETWVEGYLASSNQWVLALGLAEAPLLVSELLKLVDESCKSNPDARLANVVLDVIRTELSRGKPGQKPR
jgi:hypothetical protein